uniref:Uncharacterized protein n=1 Tax=Ditylenchus dipsaci TaxID=166011 RepID=A0A915EMW2_9BILA
MAKLHPAVKSSLHKLTPFLDSDKCPFTVSISVFVAELENLIERVLCCLCHFSSWIHVIRASKDVLEPKNFPKERYDLAKYCVESVLANRMNVSTAVTVNCYDSDLNEQELQHYVNLATKRISYYRKETAKNIASKDGVANQIKVNRFWMERRRKHWRLINRSDEVFRPSHVFRQLLHALESKFKTGRSLTCRSLLSIGPLSQEEGRSSSSTLGRNVEVKKKADPLNSTLSSFKPPASNTPMKGRLLLSIPKSMDQSLKKLKVMDAKPVEKSVKRNKPSDAVEPKLDIQSLEPEIVMNVTISKQQNPVDQSLKPKKVLDTAEVKAADKSTNKKKKKSSDTTSSTAADRILNTQVSSTKSTNQSLKPKKSTVAKPKKSVRFSRSEKAKRLKYDGDSPKRVLKAALSVKESAGEVVQKDPEIRHSVEEVKKEIADLVAFGRLDESKKQPMIDALLDVFVEGNSMSDAIRTFNVLRKTFVKYVQSIAEKAPTDKKTAYEKPISHTEERAKEMETIKPAVASIVTEKESVSSKAPVASSCMPSSENVALGFEGGVLRGGSARSRHIDDSNLSFEELQAVVAEKISRKIEGSKVMTAANLLAAKRVLEKRIEAEYIQGNPEDEKTFHWLYEKLFLKKNC